jgi:hypothetical protein
MKLKQLVGAQLSFASKYDPGAADDGPPTPSIQIEVHGEAVAIVRPAPMNVLVGLQQARAAGDGATRI